MNYRHIRVRFVWIPAFAGMTESRRLRFPAYDFVSSSSVASNC